MRKLVFIIMALCFSLGVSAQKGTPYISFFNESKDIETENWGICQDSDNVMLFANRQGLLSYDGYRWELFNLPFIPLVIEKSPFDGIIYVGANNNYGYIQKNIEGKPLYISLSGKAKSPGYTTEILFNDSSVIFYSESCISQHFFKNPDKPKQWFAERGKPFTGILAHQGKLFFNVKEKGLFRIESDTLFPIVTGYLSSDKEILFSLPYDDEKILIGTDDNRLQLFDRIKYYDFPVSNSDFLNENILTDAVFISDSLLALSTLYGGIMIINKSDGKEVNILNFQNGLPDDEIFAINIDNTGGLWLTHGYGICRVDFSLPLNNYSYYPGLKGVITSVLMHKDKLYVGTNEGLYVLDEVRDYDKVEILYKKPPPAKPEYIPTTREEIASSDITEKETPVNQEDESVKTKKQPIKRFINKIFSEKKEASEETGTEEQGTPQVQMPQKNDLAVTAPAIPPKIQYIKKTVSTLKSINYVYRKVEGVDHKCKSLVPVKNGILALTSSGLYHIEKNTGTRVSLNRAINMLAPIDDENLLMCAEDGLYLLSDVKGKWLVGERIFRGNDGINSVVIVNSGKIWLGSNNKIYQIEGAWQKKYFETKEYNFTANFPVRFFVEFVNDTIYGFSETGIYFYSPDADSFRLYSNKSLDIVEDRRYKVILSAPGFPALRIKEQWKILNNNFENKNRAESILMLFDDLEFIGIDAKNDIWLTDNQSGVYKISNPGAQEYDSLFNIFFMNVTWGDENYFDLRDLEFESEGKVISVKMRAPFYIKETSTRYQYYVEGSMNTWSEWNTSPDINLVLESGKYKVHVRAMNILGNISEEKILSFSIKPPFTKSSWFYFLISLGVIGLFIVVLRVRELKLVHDKKILEEKVQARTIEIQKKKEQIEMQRDEIFKQKEEITSSIEYASRIQTAMFSEKQLFTKAFADHFILFKPKDIVSGDFYWIESLGDKIYFAAADCTGHGVPGALMSMLGISLLNEITSEGKKDVSAARILELLREKIVMSLSSSGKDDKASDGMDIAFCIYDKKKKILHYAGAFNSLYHFRDGKLTEYKADRRPIGYYFDIKSFTNNEIRIKPGDVIYIFSDGYVDQFGGPNNKKYSSQRLKTTFTEMVNLSMSRQQETLERKFDLWKADNPQVDDVLIVGLKF